MNINLPNIFVDDVGLPLAASDVNLLKAAASLNDGISFRRLVTFDSSGSTGGAPSLSGVYAGYHTNPDPPMRIWKGFVCWRTGMTTLTVITDSIQISSEVLKIYINGVLKATVTPASMVTTTISIASGYTDGVPIVIEIMLSGSISIVTRFGRYTVQDIYATPFGSNSGWPGVPTFANIWTEVKLNQLVDAAQWVFDRLNSIPILPRRAQIYVGGPTKDASINLNASQANMYTGTVQKNFTGERFRIVGGFINYETVGLRYKIYIGGSLTYTSSTYGPGGHAFSHIFDLTGVSVGDTTEVQFWVEVVTSGVITFGQYSRWTILMTRSDTPSGGYAVATEPADVTPGPPVRTANSVRDVLNTICTAVSGAHARIVAAPHVFERSRAIRQFYGWDDAHETLAAHSYPWQFQRQGDKLSVYGTNVSIGYGQILPPADADKTVDEYTFEFTQQIVSGKAPAAATFYLDTLPGLRPGQLYYVYGTSVQWASESLAVD